jgi:DNA-binding CsgD family transcriptional regulator
MIGASTNAETTMSSADDAVTLIASTYDAALEPGRWPPLLQLISDHVGSHVARLSVGSSTQCIKTLTWAGAQASDISAYEEHFSKLDPVVPAITTAVPGTVVTDSAVSGSTLERSEFYQRWARPQGLYKVALTKFLHDGDALGILVCASRSTTERKTGSEASQLLQQLAPHLQRAMRVYLRIGQLSVEQHAAIEVLNLLTHALFVVDASARVKFANLAAEALLACADGIGCDTHGLYASTTTLTSRLRALVAQAACDKLNVATGGAMLVERQSSKPAYQLQVLPLTARTTWARAVSHGPAAVVLVIDPKMPFESAGGQLRALYGLTAAEARVACAVGRGESVRAVAEEFGVLPSTARTHLHHVFQKTGAGTQAALVRMVEQTAFIRHTIE